jgi:hypothetical protein
LEGSCGFLIKDIFLNLLRGTEGGENEERGKEDEEATVTTAIISAKLATSPPEYKSTVLPLYQPTYRRHCNFQWIYVLLCNKEAHENSIK